VEIVARVLSRQRVSRARPRPIIRNHGLVVVTQGQGVPVMGTLKERTIVKEGERIIGRGVRPANELTELYGLYGLLR
jgi:hypothetical protein